jgi:hypothetical protein
VFLLLRLLLLLLPQLRPHPPHPLLLPQLRRHLRLPDVSSIFSRSPIAFLFSLAPHCTSPIHFDRFVIFPPRPWPRLSGGQTACRRKPTTISGKQTATAADKCDLPHALEHSNLVWLSYGGKGTGGGKGMINTKKTKQGNNKQRKLVTKRKTPKIASDRNPSVTD